MERKNVDLRDDENEIVDEATGHDMKDAEVQSVKSVADAAAGIKKQPKRRGDKENSEKADTLDASEKAPSPKSKAVMANDIYKKMSKMTKEDLEHVYGKLMGEGFDFEDESDEELESVDYKVDFKEDLDALVDSEATLSEDFKAKTAVIFESALNSKMAQEIDRLEENYQTQLSEEITRTRAELVENVDSYLDYVVENWMTENKLAVQQGLRTEIAEDFMNKLKDVFTESYIDVPESKVDLVDELAEQVTELEESLNDTTANCMAMSEELEMFKREAVIREHSGDLADTQVEKLLGLAESVDFDDTESFSKKILTLKESYFTKASTKLNESGFEATEEESDDEVVSSPSMDRYVTAIRNSQK